MLELEGVSLRTLLRLSALLSWQTAAQDRSWDSTHPLYFIQHPMMLQAFSRTVLLGKSGLDTHGELLTPRLESVLRGLSGVLNGPGNTLKRISRMSLQELKIAVIAPRARSQFPLQGNDAERTAFRLFSTLLEQPRTGPNLQDPTLHTEAAHFEAQFRQHFGFRLETALFAPLWLHQHMLEHLSKTFPLRVPGPTNVFAASPRRAAHSVFGHNVDAHRPLLSRLELPWSEAVDVLGAAGIAADEASALLHQLSAPVEDLCQRLTLERYSKGAPAYLPLPLEEKPLVRVPGPTEIHLIAPNAQSFRRGIGRMVTRWIEELSTPGSPSKLTRAFHDLRGRGLERHLVALAASELPHLDQIPEQRYTPPGTSEWKGPDLTLLERASSGAVLLEAKGKHFSDAHHGSENDQFLKRVDALITETLQRTQKKLAHLRDPNLVAYAPWRSDLAALDPARCVAVVIYGEWMPFFIETWRERVRAVTHPLHTYALPYVVLSSHEWETLVHQVRHSGVSLVDTLLEQARAFLDTDELGGVRRVWEKLPHSEATDSLLERFPLLARAVSPIFDPAVREDKP